MKQDYFVKPIVESIFLIIFVKSQVQIIVLEVEPVQRKVPSSKG